MAGRHNVQNALAAIAVALHMGVADATTASGFTGFAGVKRRFTKVGEIAAAEGAITVIDAYGHHPVQIRAVPAAPRAVLRALRVLASLRPHTFHPPPPPT